MTKSVLSAAVLAECSRWVKAWKDVDVVGAKVHKSESSWPPVGGRWALSLLDGSGAPVVSFRDCRCRPLIAGIVESVHRAIDKERSMALSSAAEKRAEAAALFDAAKALDAEAERLRAILVEPAPSIPPRPAPPAKKPLTPRAADLPLSEGALPKPTRKPRAKKEATT